jgi:heat shock protein HslJ
MLGKLHGRDSPNGDPMPTHVSMLLIVGILVVGSLGCRSRSRDDDRIARADGAATRSDGAATPETEPVTPEDVEWRLAELQGKPVEPVPQGGRPPQLRLSSDGKRVSGYTGVNPFNGAYGLKDRSLRFTPLATTRRAGPPQLMQQESVLRQALGRTASWRPAGDGIELLDSAGKPLAKFTRASP